MLAAEFGLVAELAGEGGDCFVMITWEPVDEAEDADDELVELAGVVPTLDATAAAAAAAIAALAAADAPPPLAAVGVDVLD